MTLQPHVTCCNGEGSGGAASVVGEVIHSSGHCVSQQYGLTPLLFLSPSALEDDEDDDGHTVVATARGIFDSNGGVLSSVETGVSIIVPKGAISEGVEQEIYFKVCRDNSILPPLDKEKGLHHFPSCNVQ